MSMTHEEARKFIQFKADHALNAQELLSLDSHLVACDACAEYAEQLSTVETNLRQALKRQWSASPLPLRAQDVWGRNILQRLTNGFVPTRRLLIGITTLLFAFSMWQFALSSGSSSDPTFVAVLPNPTPSLFITSTRNNFSSCDRLEYAVHAGDTLESLAEKFSVPAEVIAELNDLQTIDVGSPTQIIIPLCTLTPTSTNHAPESTLTPGLQTFTTTPG